MHLQAMIGKGAQPGNQTGDTALSVDYSGLEGHLCNGSDAGISGETGHIGRENDLAFCPVCPTPSPQWTLTHRRLSNQNGHDLDDLAYPQVRAFLSGI